MSKAIVDVTRWKQAVDTRKDPWAKKCKLPSEPERRQEKQIPPSGPPGKNSPADTSTSAQWTWFWTSDFRNFKRTYLCCFQPLHLWHFVIAAIEN